jgi:serine/threonine-protein kinase RsbW
MPKEEATLTIPNDTSYLPVVGAFVRSAAAQVGFAEPQAGDIRLAVDEACTHVMQTAFEPGEAQDITITCRRQPGGLMVSIADRGLPFDPGTIAAYDARGGLDRDLSGLPFHLIQQTMDEVRFVNKGWEGKELQLVKRLEVPSVEAYFSQEELAPYDLQVEPAPLGEYTYRLMEPGEAVEVARCIYKTYGYTYPREQVYFPERVVTMNQRGEMLSAVAVTESGEVIGHCALVGEPGDQVMEVGQAVVVPAYRGRGILKGLSDLLLEEAPRRGLAGLYVVAVTIHPFSQRVCLKYGFRESALQLGYVPRQTQMAEFADEQFPQRESVIHAYLPLQEEPRSLVFAPAHHGRMLARIYDNLGLARDFAAPEDALGDEAGGPGGEAASFDLSAKVVSALGVAVVEVAGYGPGIKREVKAKLRDLCHEGISVIYLKLPLGDPRTALLSRGFEEWGFFFGGIQPRPAQVSGVEGLRSKDVLCLQYLNGPRIDYDLLKVHSEFAGQLLGYVRECDPLA